VRKGGFGILRKDFVFGRVNLEKATTEFIPVKNYPGGNDGIVFDFTSAVFVEKLNRIYMFGGRTMGNNDDVGEGTAEFFDSIWYIDLMGSTA
jgi:hypothetical protein